MTIGAMKSPTDRQRGQTHATLQTGPSPRPSRRRAVCVKRFGQHSPRHRPRGGSMVPPAAKAKLAVGREQEPGRRERGSARGQMFAKFITDDLDRSAKLLKAANFQPE